MTLIEIVIVVAIIAVIVAISVPAIRSTLRTYHLNSAVSAISGAIQTTRFRAITYGCPHTISFDQNTLAYQVANQLVIGDPPACDVNFTNVGGAVPWSTTPDVSVSPSTTLQFNPSGTMIIVSGCQAAALPCTFTLSNGITTKTLSVSGVGNVSSTP
jgi:Tfp pilus assembly protein FimT